MNGQGNTMELKVDLVSLTEEEEVFQILFEEDPNREDTPYLLLQRAFLDEEDDPAPPCYLETHEDGSTRPYTRPDAELTENRLVLYLPPPGNETIIVHFRATNRQFKKIKRLLAIILPET
ncbi:MAG: hypothetical protein V1816_14305 [Pseudomonadota bacterium]